MGSYQAGAVQALHEHDLAPDWVAGISIGAINAALIAGNPPDRVVERLGEFWDLVTEPTALWPDLPNQQWQTFSRQASAGLSVLFGQPGFFHPRPPAEWLMQPPPVSFYDTSALRATLERLVDFDRINNPAGTRLSVGATEVTTGELVYFDSVQQRIGPEHVMASGALPPGLASVEIDGRAFWDGGVVSNTPLQYVMAQEPRTAMLVFQIDLFPARGPLPENLDQVAERAKDIQYSSRTRTITRLACQERSHQTDLTQFLARLPDNLRNDPVTVRLAAWAAPPPVDIVHLIYRPAVPQGSAKDYEFGRATMQQRWDQGLADARATLEASPWEREPATAGTRTWDVLGDVLGPSG